MGDLSDIDFDDQLQQEDDYMECPDEPLWGPPLEESEPVAETVVLPVAFEVDEETAMATEMEVPQESPSPPSDADVAEHPLPKRMRLWKKCRPAGGYPSSGVKSCGDAKTGSVEGKEQV